MGINGIFKHFILGKSIKEIEINRILDKISSGKKLSDRESNFLELYNETNNDINVDFMLISKNIVYDKIKLLLSNDKVIICDLTDRYGKIGSKIITIDNDYESDECILTLKDGLFKIKDNFLYNIIYDMKRDRYSLQEHGEFYEKVNINK